MSLFGQVEVLQIEYQGSGAFKPGDLVLGNILVEVTEKLTWTSISLRFTGIAQNEWNATKNGKSILIKKKESILDHQLDLANKKEITLSTWLPNTTYRVPFGYKLPLRIPPTFSHEIGQITYKCTVTVSFEGQGENDSPLCKHKLFVVLPRVDLADHGASLRPYSERRIHKVSMYRKMCYNEGNISIQVSFEKSGYLCGEWLKCMYEINNQSNEVVTELVMKLEQCLFFRATGENDEEFYQNSKKSVAKASKRLRITAMTSCDPSVICLKTPEITNKGHLNPPTLTNCGIITVQYRVRLEANSDRSCIFSSLVPICVGTMQSK